MRRQINCTTGEITILGEEFCLPHHNVFNQDFERFVMGLASDISKEIKRSMQDVGQGFTKHLPNLSTVITIQVVSQVVGVFAGDSSKFRDRMI